MHFWGTKWSEEVYSAGILKYTVEAYKSIQSILKQHHSLAIWQMDTRSDIGFMCLWCPACVVTDHNNDVYISFLRNTQRSHIQDIRKYSAFTLLILLACTLSWWSNTRITHDKGWVAAFPSVQEKYRMDTFVQSPISQKVSPWDRAISDVTLSEFSTCTGNLC